MYYNNYTRKDDKKILEERHLDLQHVNKGFNAMVEYPSFVAAVKLVKEVDRFVFEQDPKYFGWTDQIFRSANSVRLQYRGSGRERHTTHR